MGEEETSEDGGELVTVVRRCFFPPVQEKQFVVTSSSRKHQPLFPLNQQCKNGVSVWVRICERERERERRELELWWRGTYSSTIQHPLLPFSWLFSGDTPSSLLSPFISTLPALVALARWHCPPLTPQTILSGIHTLGNACLS